MTAAPEPRLILTRTVDDDVNMNEHNEVARRIAIAITSGHKMIAVPPGWQLRAISDDH